MIMYFVWLIWLYYERFLQSYFAMGDKSLWHGERNVRQRTETSGIYEVHKKKPTRRLFYMLWMPLLKVLPNYLYILLTLMFLFWLSDGIQICAALFLFFSSFSALVPIYMPKWIHGTSIISWQNYWLCVQDRFWNGASAVFALSVSSLCYGP